MHNLCLFNLGYQIGVCIQLQGVHVRREEYHKNLNYTSKRPSTVTEKEKECYILRQYQGRIQDFSRGGGQFKTEFAVALSITRRGHGARRRRAVLGEFGGMPRKKI